MTHELSVDQIEQNRPDMEGHERGRMFTEARPANGLRSSHSVFNDPGNETSAVMPDMPVCFIGVLFNQVGPSLIHEDLERVADNVVRRDGGSHVPVEVVPAEFLPKRIDLFGVEPVEEVLEIFEAELLRESVRLAGPHVDVNAAAVDWVGPDV